MFYQDLGKDFAPLQHALMFRAGPELTDAIDRELVGITQKLTPQHPDPAVYVRGELWRWLENNLGEKRDGRWTLSGNRTFGIELRVDSRNVAMQLKLLFAGAPVLLSP